MNIEQLKPILECAIFTAGEPLSLQRLRDLFTELPADGRPTTSDLRAALMDIAKDCEARGIELQEIASGFCFQAKAEFAPWIRRLLNERPPRYTRALLETLAIIAYRQPVTRAEIEDIRGVAVSSNIIKTLLDHEWIHVVGQREVPGRPSVFATTRQFLDHFNLKTLEELPALMELQDLDAVANQLELQIASNDTIDVAQLAEAEEVVEQAELNEEVVS